MWSRTGLTPLTTLRIGLSGLILAGFGIAIGFSGAPRPVAAATASIWMQTMDSCKEGLGGGAYDLTGGGVHLSVADTAPGGARSVAPSSGCPLEQGDCSGTNLGCVEFQNVPPGVYRILQTKTPPPNATNPEGYAPCEGGSACRSEVVDVTVDPAGTVSATVTNVYPDGLTKTWPTVGGSYAGTTADPVVVHDFGLGSGSCDGDGDADDHLTGAPSSHCGYPEAEEGSVPCQPFPWSCQIPGSMPGASHHGHSSSSKTTSGTVASHHSTSSKTTSRHTTSSTTSTQHTTSARTT